VTRMAALTTPPQLLHTLNSWCVRVGYVATVVSLLLGEEEITGHACHDDGLRNLLENYIWKGLDIC
jgi:hypothetical protein